MKQFMFFLLLGGSLLISCTQSTSTNTNSQTPQEPTEEPILVLEPQGHSARVRDLMFTPDGKTLFSVSKDKTIRQWDVEAGDLLRTIRGQIAEGIKGIILAGALSPDGKILAVGGNLLDPKGLIKIDKKIRLFNTETGKQIGLLKGHLQTILALDFSRDGKWLASASHDSTVKIWDVSGIGKQLRMSPVKTLKHKDDVYGVAFSPNGKKLVSASYDHTLRLWELPGDVRKPVKFMEMRKHSAEVYCAAYAPNGQYIVSGGKDGKIILWDGNGKFLKEIDKYPGEVGTVSFSSDSKKIVICGATGDYDAIVYAIPSGEKITSFTEHNGTVVASVFYGHEWIATAGGDGYDIYVWNANSGEVKTHIVGKGKKVWALAFGEGLNIAFGNRSLAPLALQNSEQQFSQYVDFPEDVPLEKSFDLSEMLINQNRPAESNFRRIRETYRGNTLKLITKNKLHITGSGTIENEQTGVDGSIRSYTFTKEGEVVVGSDFSLKLYQNNGSFIHQFRGHTGAVLAVSVSENGRILASASADQTIKLWNLKTGECLASLFVTDDNDWICWTPQGYYAASPGGEQYIGWHINQGEDNAAKYYPAHVFRKRFLYPELVKRTIEVGSFTLARKQLEKENPQKTLTRGGPGLPPQFEWISPQDWRSETSTSSLPIRVNIRSDIEITELKVLVNGRTQAVNQEVKSSTRSSAFYKEIEHEVLLIEGENEIRIFAANAGADVTSDERIVRYNKPGTEWWKPNLYIVSIGISEYQSEKLRLEYADDDARAMVGLFNTQKNKLYNKVIAKELYNEQATRRNIIDALEWLGKQATQQDVAVIFIAAHGYNEQDKYYLLPVDGEPDALRSTGVDWSDFIDTLGNLTSRVLFFLDSCHSGQLGEDMFGLRTRGGEIDVDNTEAIRELASDENGVVILAASTAKETSQEDPIWGHGAFTKALLDGMFEGNADLTVDGIIYLRELDHYVSERVKQLTDGKQHPTIVKPSTISRFPIAQVK